MLKQYRTIKLSNSVLEKKRIIEDILEDLPAWFGIPESNLEYITKGSNLPTFVAYKENEAIGFMTVEPIDNRILELYVLGIKRKFHRKGIGKALFETVLSYAKREGYSMLQVKTLDESFVPFDEGYEHTRRFYYAIGFQKYSVDLEIWGKGCPCLIMRRKI